MAIVSECSKQECNEGDECLFGILDRTTCEHWKTTVETTVEETLVEQDSQTAPWHGDAFSKADINLVSIQRRPHLIALIGPHNAGKTTYLAAIHLLCLRQPLLPESSFAGSLTLRGWQRIIRPMQYPRDKNLPLGYPPHTPNSNERVPSLLHYTFRGAGDGSMRDVLFTDAPGEWFKSWAGNPDESMFPGAVWTVRNADTFLFFVDSEQLSGKDAGVARNTIESMAMRLAEERNGKPVGIIWSKADVPVDDVIRGQIETILSRELPDAISFQTSVKPSKGENPDMLIESLTSSVEFATTKKPIAIDFQTNFPSSDPQDRFLSYRGEHHG